MSPPYLATYGTLMRVFGQHEALGVGDRITFVTECRFDGQLYDLGRFPGAVRGEGTVHGELFRLDSPDVLERLDRYEGYDPAQEHASPFVRRRTTLRVPGGATAWVYWYDGNVRNAPRVPSGDWRVC